MLHYTEKHDNYFSGVYPKLTHKYFGTFGTKYYCMHVSKTKLSKYFESVGTYILLNLT